MIAVASVFLVLSLPLTIIAMFYTNEYYRLRNILAIRKRRPKLMLLLNCSTILYMLHSSIIYPIGFVFLPNNKLYNLIMVDGLHTLITHVFVWGNMFRFWFVFFDIRWSKTCEIDWKVLHPFPYHSHL